MLDTEIEEMKARLEMHRHMVGVLKAAIAKAESDRPVERVKILRAKVKIDPKALVGKTALEAAQYVLKRTDEPLHYNRIFTRAVKRGYDSGRHGGGNATSFWHALKRHDDIFEAVGGGKYQLKKGKED